MSDALKYSIDYSYTYILVIRILWDHSYTVTWTNIPLNSAKSVRAKDYTSQPLSFEPLSDKDYLITFTSAHCSFMIWYYVATPSEILLVLSSSCYVAWEKIFAVFISTSWDMFIKSCLPFVTTCSMFYYTRTLSRCQYFIRNYKKNDFLF